MEEIGPDNPLLLIDTCGERGSVALFRGEVLAVEVFLEERTASAGLLGAVREVLGTAEMSVRDLSGIGVVNGPGSFTGVRVGLAVVKGLCESANLRVGTASRLAVLQELGGDESLAVLRAGRDEVYVREGTQGGRAREYLTSAAAFLDSIGMRSVIYAEGALEPMFANISGAVCVELSARHAYRQIKASLDRADADLSTLDANYVRDVSSIYNQRQVKK